LPELLPISQTISGRLKLILNATNEKTTERIIEIAYKDLKKEETPE